MSNDALTSVGVDPMPLRTSLPTSALASELDSPDSQPLDLEDSPPEIHLEILPEIHLGICPAFHLGIHPEIHPPLVVKLLLPASCLASSD